MKPLYAIRHIQIAATGAWCWFVCFSRDGKMTQSSFYDHKLGGSVKARKAAITWRDEQLTKVPAMSVATFCQKKRSNNASGVPGVHFLHSPRQPEGFWQAKIKLGGKGRTKNFSVLQHGHQKAFELAVAAREVMLEEAEKLPYVYDPVAKRAALKQVPLTTAV